MKTIKQLAAATWLACAAAAFAAEPGGDPDAVALEPERNHAFYVGFGFGPTELKPANESRSVEGIDFAFTASSDDVGSEVHAGYWIDDHVAIELGMRDYGTINVPFTFHDPHDNSSGTGESEVDASGGTVAALLGYDLTPTLQVFLRGGVLMWKEKFDSRFDIPGEAAMHRTYEQSGVGMIYGAGLSYRFHGGWALQGQYEHSALDPDEATMMTIGFTYDFIDLVHKYD